MSTHDLSQTPSLFDAPPPGTAVKQPAREERGTLQLARDFVRWCCSVGDKFRNSPDVLNLRYWARKNKLKIKDREESEVLELARPLYLKRIEQLIRKAETPN
ncbi:MAG TPA: hypothetical protein VE422_36325 [Terriglobia bacterium]|nr:hypothetical protein [Terriglobia bacterium]